MYSGPDVFCKAYSFSSSALPTVGTFDGPRLQPEDIVECLLRSNVPTVEPYGRQQHGPPPDSRRNRRQCELLLAL